MIYRNLTSLEIGKLTHHGCIAENWDNITVHRDFSPEYIKAVTFSGKIKLGVLEESFTLPVPDLV